MNLTVASSFTHWNVPMTSLKSTETEPVARGAAQFPARQRWPAERWIPPVLKLYRLGDSKSFGLFPNDIDAIGGLCIAYLDTESRTFMSAIDRLVHSLLANQGAEGQWRWLLSRRGNCRRIFDVTYAVHQLGMGPWGFTLYRLTRGVYSDDLALRVVKGIRWILGKQPFSERFIVRSFSGLTGRPVELEQRTYEAGLNLLGLLSYHATETHTTQPIGG